MSLICIYDTHTIHKNCALKNTFRGCYKWAITQGEIYSTEAITYVGCNYNKLNSKGKNVSKPNGKKLVVSRQKQTATKVSIRKDPPDLYTYMVGQNVKNPFRLDFSKLFPKIKEAGFSDNNEKSVKDRFRLIRVLEFNASAMLDFYLSHQLLDYINCTFSGNSRTKPDIL